MSCSSPLRTSVVAAALVAAATVALAGCSSPAAPSAAPSAAAPAAATATAGDLSGGQDQTSTDPDGSQVETSTQPLTQPFSTVVIDADAGDVTIHSGDAPTLSVTRTWTGSTRPELVVALDGTTLRIGLTCPGTGGRCQGTIDLAAPPATAAQVKTGAGAVTVAGLSGAQDLSTGAGRITGTDLTAPTVAAHAGSGAVELTMTRPATQVDAETQAGNVSVTTPGGTLYTITADTNNTGPETSDIPTTDGAPHSITARTNAGRATITATQP